MISYEGAEYFLFKSKTETCSDYATAFVLLAREAGLAARYAEVYLPEDSFSEYGRNTYMVTQSDSHAYAEVFLENTGWLVFDPTSGVRNRERAGLIRFFKAIHVDYAMILIIARVLILLALFFLFIQFILPLVGEAIFLLRIIFTDEIKMIPLVYRRLLRKSQSKDLIKDYAITPREFSGLIYERGYDISGFIERLERVLYGRSPERERGPELKDELIESYRKACIAISKYGKET